MSRMAASLDLNPLSNVFLQQRHKRCKEIIARHQLNIPLHEVASDDDLERAVTTELLDKLVDSLQDVM